jgi:hypothetical protein
VTQSKIIALQVRYFEALLLDRLLRMMKVTQQTSKRQTKQNKKRNNKQPKKQSNQNKTKNVTKQ